MKIVALPIDMMAMFTKSGIPSPIKFRVTTESQENTVVKIDRVFSRETENLAGNKMHIFKCSSVIDDIERPFELKYELETCKWMLYKI